MVSKNLGNVLVYIIVLSYNSRHWLYRCVLSLLKTEYDNFRVLLVDNASTDGSADEIADMFPEIILIKNKKNYGWCKGNNIGIQYALEHGADMVFLSNADTEYHRTDWLTRLVDIYKRYPEYTILGPMQYEYNDENTLNEWSKYIMENGDRNVHYMWSDDLNLVGRSYGEGDLLFDLLDVYFVQGAAMLIHKDAFETIGLFDPMYYIFFDEVDFSRRNLRIGNRIGVVPSSQIKHFGSGDNSSNRKNRWKRNYFFVRNKYYFILSDYQMKHSVKREILKKWIQCDIRDALTKKKDISGIHQLILIYLCILTRIPIILKKKKREAILERKNIVNKVIKCIRELIPEFKEEDMIANLNLDFGLDSIGVMELILLIEEEFNIVFDVNVDMEQLYLPEFMVDYIYEYQR